MQLFVKICLKIKEDIFQSWLKLFVKKRCRLSFPSTYYSLAASTVATHPKPAYCILDTDTVCRIRIHTGGNSFDTFFLLSFFFFFGAKWLIHHLGSLVQYNRAIFPWAKSSPPILLARLSSFASTAQGRVLRSSSADRTVTNLRADPARDTVMTIRALGRPVV